MDTRQVDDFQKAFQSPRVLIVAPQCRTADWLVLALSSEGFVHHEPRKAQGASEALAMLRRESFDVVLIWHEPPLMNGPHVTRGLRAVVGNDAILVVGQAEESVLSVECHTAGADGYLVLDKLTPRYLHWSIERAREYRRGMAAERSLVECQRRLKERDDELVADMLSTWTDLADRIGGNTRTHGGSPRDFHNQHRSCAARHRELLLAYCLMEAGSLRREIEAVAREWVAARSSIESCLRLHCAAVEEMLERTTGQARQRIVWRAQQLLVEILAEISELGQSGQCAPPPQAVMTESP